MGFTSTLLLTLAAQAGANDGAVQLAEPPMAARPVPGLAAGAPTSRSRLAVMKLEAAGVPPEYAEGLTETIATSVAETGVFETISPRQIASLLAYEKRKELLGGCVEEDCYLQVAKAVKAEHLVGGSVAQVGAKLVLNLVLIDALEGRALKRANRETSSATELMTEVRAAAVVLLQPVLNSRQGYLKVAVNVPDASLVVDDERRGEGVGQVIALAAGPHVLKVVRDGFYTSTADVFVRPSQVAVQEVKLIPARETVESYESRAKLMRWGAYGTALAAVGAAVAGGVFYGRATDDKAFVDTYASALDSERASLGSYDDVLARRDSFGTNQALYLSMLGTALVSGGISLYLFLAGEDPDRYAEFHSLNGM